MRVQLDECPLWSPLQLNPLRQPGVDATARAWVFGGERGAVDAQGALVFAKSQPERPLNHQDAVVHHLTDTRPDAAFVSARALRIARWPIDLIDDVGLRLVG